MIDRITDALSLLVRFPAIGRERVDLRPGMRSFAVESYVVLYRLRPSEVQIVRVIHGNRDIQGSFSRD
jgi:toxin ParE1/3/4